MHLRPTLNATLLISVTLAGLIIAACAALQLFLLRYWFLDAPFLT